jgi:alanine-glyoxylate transaminase/serine-glyoxylate transaminase/serine-pyruvate transaminase
MLARSEKDKLLMIPGPTPVHWEILQALGEPPISHTGPEIAAIMRRALQLLHELMDNADGHVFVFAGSGTLAQEAAVVNFVEPGQRLLVASNGYFGDRFVPIARAHGIDVEVLAARWGTSVTPDELARVLDRGRFVAVTLTHVETSTGVMAPLEELVTVAHECDVLCIVDGVCALGGIPEPMKRSSIDVLLSGAQKALGVPPGLSILGVSHQAWERRERRSTPVNAYYADLSNWLPSMQDPQRYFSTHAVNLMYALRTALEIIVVEGFEARYARHRQLAEQFRAGMAELGFEPVTDPQYLAPTLSVLRVPHELNPHDLRQELARQGVIAAAALGEFADTALRFGHMGNISAAEIAQTLAATKSALAHTRTGAEAPGHSR